MQGAPYFKTICGHVLFFRKMVPNGPQMASTILEHLIKNDSWNEVDKTNENVYLWKTSFRMDGLQHSTKIRTRKTFKICQKHVSKYSPNPWQMYPGAQQKTMLKNRPHKTKTNSNTDSQMNPKKMTLFFGWRLLGHLWWPKPFWGTKSGPPALPKCFQWSKNATKIAPKSSSIPKKSSNRQTFSDKTRGADKCWNMSKQNGETHPNSMKNRSRSSTKAPYLNHMFKTQS